ncbi:hypothetical protein PtB15_6B326 [Puccinia triticina]|nr:hypothetical protein PtB15_6B326 [Puccinia triticina]
MESGHLDREQANELELDSIGLEENTSSTASESDCEPFEGLDPAVYSLFDNSVDPDGDANGEISWDNHLFEALNQLADEPVPWEFLTKKRPKADQPSWYPFKEKEYLIGSLMMGYMHHIMSRNIYAQLRLIISLTGCKLPHWKTLVKARVDIRKMLNLKLHQQTSILNNECYSVSLSALLKQAYIRDFLHIDSSGEHCPVASRNWEYIKEQSVELWELAQDGVKCHYDDPSKEKGICDNINRRFVEKLFDKANPKLKAEVLRLAKEDLERLFNSFLKLKDKLMDWSV